MVCLCSVAVAAVWALWALFRGPLVYLPVLPPRRALHSVSAVTVASDWLRPSRAAPVQVAAAAAPAAVAQALVVRPLVVAAAAVAAVPAVLEPARRVPSQSCTQTARLALDA